MRIPTEDDFSALQQWGIIQDPFAAIEDHSEAREQRRWENERHCQAHREQVEGTSEAFVADTQSYYQTMERPIDRTKWEFLKRRKAWFHPPLGWARFAAPGTSRILDLGCGDGDVTQRVAEFVSGTWMQAGYDGFPMEIVGVDVNESRLQNARELTESPHPNISLRFERADALKGLNFADDYFDFTLLVGFLEVLDDATPALDEAARLTAHGLYVRDVLDEYPGLSPRPELPTLLADRGFDVVDRERVFEEPFVEEGSADPLEVWPMNVHQVVFAEARSEVSRDERY